MDAQGGGGTGGLVAGDALDVDDVFQTVDGDDLALAALVGATDDGDLVVLADGDGADLEILLAVIGIESLIETYVVLLTELLGERSAHDGTALVRGSTVVSGAALAARRGDHYNPSISISIPLPKDKQHFNRAKRGGNVLLSNFIVAVSKGDRGI